MPSKPRLSNEDAMLQRALARWENEGGKTFPLNPTRANEADTPEMTNAEIVALRVRVIALENLMISILATASKEQLGLMREMAAYISPRAGFALHPLTAHAAEHMIDLIDRSARFRREGRQKQPVSRSRVR